MTYSIKEIYFTIQGEGMNTGKPSVFCRFSGCNLWSGFEKDRHAASCNFCDTDFVGTDGIGGGKFKAASKLARAIKRCWQEEASQLMLDEPFVVCTGGEPLLQLDEALIEELHNIGFTVAVETNGTILAPSSIDWICVSPKTPNNLEQISGDEIKLVYPQKLATPDKFENMDFNYFLLQPLDDKNHELNTQMALKYCQMNPTWQLSVQTHKYLGLP